MPDFAWKVDCVNARLFEPAGPIFLSLYILDELDKDWED
jgi:hypothetical protein